jgi:hypothetical protein
VDAVDGIFQAQLSGAIHGEYQLHGFQELAVDISGGADRRQGVELHESVHAELCDVSAYGRFQQFVWMTTGLEDPQLRARADSALAVSMAATRISHEGLATLREYAWITSQMGAAAGADYIGTLPPMYQEGLTKTLTLFEGSDRGGLSDTYYLGFDAPSFHVTVIAVGLILLNGGVLEQFVDPRSVLESELDWVPSLGPDERLNQLLNNLDDTRSVIIGGLEVASQIGGDALIDMEVRHAFYDQVLEQAQASLPMEVLNLHTDFVPQIRAFKQQWIPYINEKAGRTVVLDESGTEDLTHQRALAVRFERKNAGHHEEDEVDKVTVELSAFVEYHQRAQVSGMFRLLVFGTRPAGIADELLSLADVGIGSFPMWHQGVSTKSPLVRFEPVVVCETTMQSLLDGASALAGLPCVWYTSLSLAGPMREQGLQFDGWLIERCDSAQELIATGLLGRDSTTHYGLFKFGKEIVLCILTGDRLRYSVGGVNQEAAFLREMQRRGVAAMSPEALVQWGEPLPVAALARAAMWSLTGG